MQFKKISTLKWHKIFIYLTFVRMSTRCFKCALTYKICSMKPFELVSFHLMLSSHVSFPITLIIKWSITETTRIWFSSSVNVSVSHSVGSCRRDLPTYSADKGFHTIIPSLFTDHLQSNQKVKLATTKTKLAKCYHELKLYFYGT